MDRIEVETYRRHRFAALFEGVFGVIIWSTPEITRKALDAPILLITLIVMAPAVTQTLAIFVAGRIAASRPRRLIRTAAILGRTPLILLAFFSRDPWLILILITIQALASVTIVSAWNSVLRTNYTAPNRGTLFGRASRFQSIAAATAVIGTGIWARHDGEAYRWFIPLAAILGVIGCSIFSSTPLRSHEKAAPSAVRLSSFGLLLDVLVKDARFRRYEIGFFLYGLGFMALATAKPLISVDTLDLEWDVLLGAKAIPSICGVFLAPLFGRWMDRIGPPRLGALSFACLVLYAGALALARGPVGYCVAEGVFGTAMTGVLLIWNMGPVAFAPGGRAMHYMSVHVALVGVRGLIGHPIGGVIAAVADPRWVLVFSSIAWLAGSLVMASLGRRMREDAKNQGPKGTSSWAT